MANFIFRTPFSFLLSVIPLNVEYGLTHGGKTKGAALGIQRHKEAKWAKMAIVKKMEYNIENVTLFVPIY